MTPGTAPPLKQANASALLVVMGTMWGLQFAMLKLATEGGYSDLGILTLALFLLSIAFIAIMLVRKEAFRLNQERIVFLLVTGMLGYVLPLWATLYAAPHIKAGVLTMLATLSPVAAISVALLLRSEPVSPRRIMAVILGSGAVLLVMWPELYLPDLGVIHWMLIALVVPVCYGVESIYIARYWPTGMTSLQAVTGETVMALVLVIPIFILMDGQIPTSIDWGPAELGIAIFVLAGVLESLLYFYLIKNTGGVFVNFGAFISLFAGIAWGIVLFSESHGPEIWLAVGLLCAALALACFDRLSFQNA